MDTADFTAIIARIYDAAIDPAQWDDVLRQITHFAHADRAALFSLDPFSEKGGLIHTLAIDTSHPELERLQLADPRLEFALTHPPEVYTDEKRPDLFARFLRSELYAEIAGPQDSEHLLGVVLPFGQGGQAALGFHRSGTRGSFTAAEAGTLEIFLPHIRRALLIHRQVSHARRLSSVSNFLIEQISVGMALLTRDGEIVHANAAARALFDANDGLAVKQNRLTSTHPDHAKTLAREIAQAAALRQGKSLSAGAVLRLTRPSGRQAYSVLLAPAGASSSALFDEAKGADVVALLRDPEMVMDIPGDIFVRYFGLSPAEARIAQGLVRGWSIDEIAAAHDLARETVRSELKRVFKRTGTRSQSELVRYLLAGLAPIAGPFLR